MQQDTSKTNAFGDRMSTKRKDRNDGESQEPISDYSTASSLEVGDESECQSRSRAQFGSIRNQDTGCRASEHALFALIQSVQKASQERAAQRGCFGDNAQAQPRPPADKSKKRKPTNTIRKQEITELQGEIQRLGARLEFLKGHASSSQDPRVDSTEHPLIPNAVLRDLIHEHEISMASARSVISQFTASDWSLLVHCYIHLPKAVEHRHRILRAVKPEQLRLARRFILERSRYLNVNVAHAASERFIKENGDACHLRFSLAQFPGCASVRDVFEAASFFTSCLEISLTDGVGHVTIREEDTDMGDPTLAQNRFLTSVGDDLLVEGNIVLFKHFDEDDDYGIVAATFVDQDDLYPYRTRERIRQDVTAVLMIARERDGIVVRRFGSVRVHHNDHISAPTEVLQELSECVGRWGDAILKHTRVRFACG